MQLGQNINIRDDNEVKNVISLLSRNYRLFAVGIILALILATVVNRFMVPVYRVSAALLIKQESRPAPRDANDFLNSSLFGNRENFQNELSILKSTPVLEQTVRNLDLNVSYNFIKGLRNHEAYRNTPFKVLFVNDHIQPVGARFSVVFKDNNTFTIKSKARNVTFKKVESSDVDYEKKKWEFQFEGECNKLIETPDLAFVILPDTMRKWDHLAGLKYEFTISDLNSVTTSLKRAIEYHVIQNEATVVEIELKSPSLYKARDIVNEVMNVYSQQNLDRKNHIADKTIDYIEKQLDEISDSLKQTENKLQNFKSSNQLLNLSEQATGIATQYRDLENQLAELVTRKRYYDYVADFLSNNEDFSEMIVPASMGIQDQLLNTLMADLITAQAQRSALIQNKQEKNPLVQKLSIQIENSRKTITENISAVRKTTDLSIEEMQKRVRKVESEISRLPGTQRQLGGIERKYRLNDAIYNYLLEKRAEAQITKASNLPDNMVIEPANMVGSGPVSPKVSFNYLIALFLGMGIPFGFLTMKSLLNTRIESQEDIEKLSNLPVMGKLLHNPSKSGNLAFESPRSGIAESFRALRTNIEYHYKGVQPKVILITSSIEGEGKSFTALNLAISYAQLGMKTVLVNLDLRKPTNYFGKEEDHHGLSTFLAEKIDLEKIIKKTSFKNLDYIAAGPIPPNPIELLATQKASDLTLALKKSYQCIVVDSTPLAQVSDAFLFMEYTDVKLIVTRYNYSIKKVFALIVKDLNQKNINHIGIVLNDNRLQADQYGYGYGYGNQKKKNPLISWVNDMVTKQ